jgi:hypothetical protein
MTAAALDLTPVRASDLDAVAALVRALHWPHRREDIDLFLRLGVGQYLLDQPATAR